MLIFPKGIRFVRSHEIPDSNGEKPELLEKIRNANIVQGYVISHPIEESKFRYYAEANINADKIWHIFRTLCEVLLPDEVMPIIGELGDEPLHNGEYDDKIKLLDLLEEFKFYLANDCYIRFGLGFESEIELTEIFVTPTKHFQIWVNRPDALKQVMEQYGIPESEKLQFIDEFPRTTTSLTYDSRFVNHEELTNYLVEQIGDNNNSHK